MRRAALTLLATSCALSASAHAQPSFEVITTLPQTSQIDVRISADGQIVTIGSIDVGLAGGAARIELATGASTLLAFGIAGSAFPSADGSVVMGVEHTGSGAGSVYRWTAESRIIVPTFASVTALSADGSRYAGVRLSGSALEAFVATYAPGTPVLTPLGDLPGGSVSSEARGISGDGTVVVGRSAQALGFEAFRWTSADGMVGLGDLPGGAFASDANDVSQDGTTVVGHSTSASGTEAFVWQDGGLVGLGDLEGGSFASRAFGVNADGSVVVGSGTRPLPPGGGWISDQAAFVWDAEHGMRDLELLLENDYGLDVEDGTFLLAATDVSADGYTIVGHGLDGPERFVWVAVIPEASASAQLGAGLLALAGLSRPRANARSPRG